MSGEMTLPIELITPGDNLRRKLVDLGPLVKSIEALGVLQPLVVVVRDGEHVLVAGHRRLAAAKKAGLTDVPVVVKDLTDAEITEAMVVENLQRADLSPIEQAEGLFRLTELGMTQKAIAADVGMKAKLVSERLKLLQLPAPAQDRVHDGQLSIDAALGLAKDPVEVVEEFLRELDDDPRFASIDTARRRVKRQELLTKLDERVEKLREKGFPVEVLTGGYDEQAPKGWRPIGSGYGTGRYNRNALDVPEKQHRREPCAGFVYTRAQERNWQEPAVDQWCTTPARHKVGGDSELTYSGAVEDVEKRAEQTAERERKREVLDGLAVRYAEAVTGRPKSGPVLEAVAWLFMSERHRQWGEVVAMLGIGDREVEAKSWQDEDKVRALDYAGESKAALARVLLATVIASVRPGDPYHFRVGGEAASEKALALLVEEYDLSDG